MTLARTIVLAALCVTAGVFFFARPEYDRPYESKMIDFAHERYYSPHRVRSAFAGHGIPLVAVDGMAGFVTFYRPHSRGDAQSLQVSVAPRDGTGSWGPELEHYDERFGNVLVTYGGRDEALLRRIRAAVSSIRKDS